MKRWENSVEMAFGTFKEQWRNSEGTVWIREEKQIMGFSDGCARPGGALACSILWELWSCGCCAQVGFGICPSLLDSAVPHMDLDFALKGFVSLFSRGTRRGRCGSTISAPGPTTACPVTPAASWISWRRCTTSRRAFLMQGLSWSTAGESMGWAPPATPPFGLDSWDLWKGQLSGNCSEFSVFCLCNVTFWVGGTESLWEWILECEPLYKWEFLLLDEKMGTILAAGAFQVQDDGNSGISSHLWGLCPFWVLSACKMKCFLDKEMLDLTLWVFLIQGCL